ncbi:hypothetical protein ACOI22_03520 [Glaciecola sp. 2405UD65-10]|uniref:hypothetical protein n=1 Tax=Glaciecola sp. 2405UD65-10 TaxID=3397244 RepID=UPI003B5C370B
MRKYSTAALLALTILMTGCVSTMNKLADIGVVRVTESAFDKSTEVTISKTHNFSGDDYNTPSTQFSGYWTESDKNHFKLILEMHGSSGTRAYTDFKRIDFNFDGDIRSFNVGPTSLSDDGYNSVAGTIFTQSKAVAYLPIEVLDKMMNDPDVRIRVYTSDGYEDIIYHVGNSGLASYSKEMFKPFYDEINKYR